MSDSRSGQSHPQVDLDALIELFYPATTGLGTLRHIDREEMPTVYRPLLDHDDHMTITVEAYHHSLVDVRVLAERQEQDSYARKILLARQSDGRVVQFGIMRVATAKLNDQLRAEIAAKQEPLGRIFIRHNVLRDVELDRLWEVAPGDELREFLAMDSGEITYGRTAQILVAGSPNVELLEIVAPCR